MVFCARNLDEGKRLQDDVNSKGMSCNKEEQEEQEEEEEEEEEK